MRSIRSDVLWNRALIWLVMSLCWYNADRLLYAKLCLVPVILYGIASYRLYEE